MLSLDLITSSQNHLHRTLQEGEQGLYGQQTPSPSYHRECCKGHLHPWKIIILPFSGHQGSNLTLACSQKVDLGYMTTHIHGIVWGDWEWWFHLLESLTPHHLSIKSCLVPNCHMIFGGNSPVHFLLWSHEEGENIEISFCSSILGVLRMLKKHCRADFPPVYLKYSLTYPLHIFSDVQPTVHAYMTCNISTLPILLINQIHKSHRMAPSTKAAAMSALEPIDCNPFMP